MSCECSSVAYAPPQSSARRTRFSRRVFKVSSAFTASALLPCPSKLLMVASRFAIALGRPACARLHRRALRAARRRGRSAVAPPVARAFLLSLQHVRPALAAGVCCGAARAPPLTDEAANQEEQSATTSSVASAPGTFAEQRLGGPRRRIVSCLCARHLSSSAHPRCDCRPTLARARRPSSAVRARLRCRAT